MKKVIVGCGNEGLLKAREIANKCNTPIVGSSVKLRPTINENPKHRGKHFVVKQFLTEDLVKVQWQKDIEYFYKRELMLV